MINTQMLIKNKWHKYSNKLPNYIYNQVNLELFVSKFYLEILSKLRDDQFMLIIFRIKTDDNLIRNISPLQRINKLDKDFLLDSFTEYWNLKSDNYIQFNIYEKINTVGKLCKQ